MPTPTRPLARLPGRVVRWGFFVIALVLGTALLVSSITSYLGARDLLETVIRGQAESLQRELHQHMRSRDRRGPPDDEELRAFVEEHADQGVRHVTLFGPGREPRAQAGNSVDARPLPPGQLRVVGDRVQVSFGPRGPGPEGKAGSPGPPPPGMWLDGPPGPPPLALGPPPTLIEFRPEAALALRARARRDLGVGVTVAVALMLASGVFWRLSRRAQAMAARMNEQRHLAALGEMSAVLAHEIRNPLAALKGHAQLLAERVEGDRPLERKTGHIVDAAQRLETLTYSLLDFARTAKIDPAPVDPTALLRRSADACSAPVELTTEGAPEVWTLDETKIEQVLGNLLDNAAQAAPSSPVEATVRADGGQLVFEVRDHGPGVPPDQRARIFQPFHTTRTRGTGLGLAVTRRIVELHGGEVEVLDAPGGGACFRVTMPPDPTW